MTSYPHEAPLSAAGGGQRLSRQLLDAATWWQPHHQGPDENQGSHFGQLRIRQYTLVVNDG